MKRCCPLIVLLVCIALLFMGQPLLAASTTAAGKTASASREASPHTAPQKEAAGGQNVEDSQAAETAEEKEKNDFLLKALEQIDKTAVNASEQFHIMSKEVEAKAGQFEARAAILLREAHENWDWDYGMEATRRNIVGLIAEINAFVDPYEIHRQDLLNTLATLTQSTPSGLESNLHSQKSEDTLARERSRAISRLGLVAALTQYRTTVAPVRATLHNLETVLNQLTGDLAGVWKKRYLHKRLEWYSPAVWARYAKYSDAFAEAMKIRLPVDLPVTRAQTLELLERLFTALLLFGIFCLLFRHRFLTGQSTPAMRHLCNVSLPVLSGGFALLFASVEFSGETLGLILASGNLCFIAGQVLLAWDLRCMANPDVTPQKSPLWHMLPLTFATYSLIYLPLLSTYLLVAWLACIVVALTVRHFRTLPDTGPLHLEKTILESEGIVLWVCLALTLAGLHMYSMILYMVFVSTSLASQLSIGGMAHISHLNEHLPSEGVRAVLASLLVALAAPLVLVIAVVSVLMWVATLPGGEWLLKAYIFKSVRIGATNFDLWKILLIISLFFLTRAAIILCSRFLRDLPDRIRSFDATFIPPVQTAFTYAIWALYGIFVLRSLGLELSNLAMVAGGLSVGVGLGLQGIVGNFFSGLVLIFSRMLQTGDVIEVGNVTGRVRKISVRDTLVETYDSAMIYVPNSEFVSGRLINWTRNNPIVRSKINVGVAYGSDTALVKKLLQKIANEHEAVLKYPAPSVVFTDFGASSLDFTLRYWVKDYDASVGTSSDIRMEIDRQFAANHIEIAFPQMDVHVKEMPPKAKKRIPASRMRPHLRRLQRSGRSGVGPDRQGSDDESLRDLRENAD